MGWANSDEIRFQYQLLNVEIYSKADWNFIHILKTCHSPSGQHWLLNTKDWVQCRGRPRGICDNSGSGCFCCSGTGGSDTSCIFIAIKIIIMITAITIQRPCNRNTVQVECQSNSDTSNNRGNWNHLKIIQTIPEQQHGESTKSENYTRQPYWTLHTCWRVLM